MCFQYVHVITCKYKMQNTENINMIFEKNSNFFIVQLDRDSLRANILDKTPRHKLPRGLKCVETHLPGSNILVGYGPRPSTVGHAELQAMKLRDKNKFHARNTAYGFYLATQDTPDRRTHSGLSYVNYFFPSVMLRSIRALSIHYMQVSNPNFDIPHADSPQIEKGGPECKAMQKALVDMICEDQGIDFIYIYSTKYQISIYLSQECTARCTTTSSFAALRRERKRKPRRNKFSREAERQTEYFRTWQLNWRKCKQEKTK